VISLMPLAFFSIKRSFVSANSNKKYKEDLSAEYKAARVLITVSAVIIRIVCGFKYDVHTDLSCFKYWANHMYEVGPLKFYDTASFADYPPGYMYILWIVAFFEKIFGIDSGSSMGTLFIKSPAIIFDIATAYIIYAIAKKHLNEHSALVCFIMYIFNPVVILNSAVWGQVDSVFGLGIFLMCYFIYIGKVNYSYFCFFAALLIKPQALMFAPVLLGGMGEQVIIDNSDENKKLKFKFDKSALFEQGAWLLGAIAAFILIISPFNLLTVFEKYKSTMGSYEYASVNAYNLWCMFGLDWIGQDHIMLGMKYQTIGTIFIAIICITVLIIWLKNTRDKSRYFMIGIYLCVGVFTLSVRMHERYIYPALILMLLLFIVDKKPKLLWFYGAFSIAHFYNAAHVLFYYDPSNFDRRNIVIILVSLLHVILFSVLAIFTFKAYLKADGKDSYKRIEDYADMSKNVTKKSKKTKKKKETIFERILHTETIENTKAFIHLTKTDWIIMGVLTVIYACIAFYNLGDMDAPQSFWETQDYYTDIDIQLPKDTKLKEVKYYLGNYEERKYSVYVTDKEDGYSAVEGGYVDPESREMNSVFCWSSWTFDGSPVSFMRIKSNSNCCVIGELVLIDTDGNKIVPENVNDEKLKGLFDEQEKLPEKFSYRNSTYFDEIYHARTAYEYNNHLYSYENTHPPLGKVLISWGMKIFGVCPFGWRFAGTFLGVLMVPLMYLFIKQMIEKTSITTIGCILFTFDFMHFSQSRIATIDVFVTFFIILMYYFMYLYTKKSFYDSKLSSTFIPLGICAAMMGLACAAKWTGVYAALGLAVIFFYTIFKRYREYRFAKQDIKGSTNSILHKHVVEVYKKYTWATLGFCVATFIFMAGTIYTLSYIPFVSGNIQPNTEKYAIGRLVDKVVTGEDAPVELHSLFGRMLANQYTMFSYHSEVKFEHAYASRWYEWPLIIKPIWYYSGVLDGDMREGISAFGNPLVWWAGIAAFIYMLKLWIKKKDQLAMFITIGYFAGMIPWVPIARLTFIYHYFPSVPFVVLMVIYAIYRIVEEHPECEFYKIDLNGEKPALVKTKVKTIYLMYAYAALVIILFIMFYPVLSGAPVDKDYVSNWLRWFDSWQLISY
ncbi:MAG: glycosyltransferase family 39 protein, partial [Lachnospiraceae bacterium]|nr:glycosyltransferase family 39 protein [Lachnospiraceae bacterium]